MYFSSTIAYGTLVNVLPSSERGVELEIFLYALMTALEIGQFKVIFPLLIASIKEFVVTTPMILCSSFITGN